MIENRWEKIGMIFEAGSDNEDLLTHASNPVAIHLANNVYRIFYCGRNKENKSSVSFVDFDLLNLKIVNNPRTTLLKYGEKGTFYSHGITIGNCWSQGTERFIGFMGWQNKKDQHWRGDIGKFNLHTLKVNKVLGTNHVDKISLSYPYVLRDNNRYIMWYGSTISWESESIDKEMIHTINYATSIDGDVWEPQGQAVPWDLNVAQAFSKPSVVRERKGFKMWYSHRSGDGTKYKLGYSTSEDGVSWDFHESNLKRSNYGWDSEMVCYPYVFEREDRYYMLYNGNEFGKYGFGLACSSK
jgi:hypothetical protein